MLIGIVGKPNTGKSTFFKALTLMNVLIENYPFATIKPNKGVGYVRVECVEKEFNIKCTPAKGYCVNNTRYVPVKLLDVAGLVPGAHEGKGMGNQFLDDLRMADALVHIIDASGSTNEKGEIVKEGSYNPANDIKFLEEELDYWYLGILNKNWNKFARKAEQTHTELYRSIAEQLSGLRVTEDMVKDVLKGFSIAKPTEWTNNDLLKLSRELRIITKPIIIAANKMDRAVSRENVKKLKDEFPGKVSSPCNAEVELALREANNKSIIAYAPGNNNFTILKQDLPENQLKGLEFIKKFLSETGSTGVQDVLDTAVFKVLKFIAIFPGGVKGFKDSKGRTLPDCFLLPGGSTALDFAYTIHSDIGDKFVKAIDVRTRKALGKDYKLKHRDVIEIMTR